MSIGRKNNRIPNEMNPNIIMPDETDYRAKMIYHRYLTGRSIIIDDLKYLWIKDPDGFEKLALSIVEAQNGQDLEMGYRSGLETEDMDSEGVKNRVNLEDAVMAESTDSTENKDNTDNTSYEANSENKGEQLSFIQDESATADTSEDLPKIQDILTSAKDMIENMTEVDLMDLLKNLNEAVELEKINNSMKYWNDSFSDRMVMYTVDENKEFNTLA